jgi:hypothetical protein
MIVFFFYQIIVFSYFVTSFKNKQIQTLLLKVRNFNQLKLKVYFLKNKQEQKK